MFCFPTFHVCFSCFFHISVISVQPSRMNNTITHARFGGIPLAYLYVSTPYIERNRALSTHRTLGSMISRARPRATATPSASVGSLRFLPDMLHRRRRRQKERGD